MIEPATLRLTEQDGTQHEISGRLADWGPGEPGRLRIFDAETQSWKLFLYDGITEIERTP